MVIKESLTKPIAITVSSACKHSIVVKQGVKVHLLLDSTGSEISVHVEKDAILDFYYLSSENVTDTKNKQSLHITLEANAQVRMFDLGINNESLVRTIKVNLAGKGARASYYGIDQLSSQAKKSTWLTMIHQTEKTISEQNFRGVYGQTAEGFFLGKVVIERVATNCDARQLYKAIILNPESKARVLPQLEVNNSDVSASHGASIGQLDENALFYLRSRGLSLGDAEIFNSKEFFVMKLCMKSRKFQLEIRSKIPSSDRLILGLGRHHDF